MGWGLQGGKNEDRTQMRAEATVVLKGEEGSCSCVSVFLKDISIVFAHRNSKPRNRPSFRQILLHLDIASADIMSTPQETYFQSQVPNPPHCQ